MPVADFAAAIRVADLGIPQAMAGNDPMRQGSCAELAPGAVPSPPKLNIPPKTQVRVISSLIDVGIR